MPGSKAENLEAPAWRWLRFVPQCRDPCSDRKCCQRCCCYSRQSLRSRSSWQCVVVTSHSQPWLKVVVANVGCKVVLCRLLVLHPLRNSSVVLRCRLEDLLKTRKCEQARATTFTNSTQEAKCRARASSAPAGRQVSKLRTTATYDKRSYLCVGRSFGEQKATMSTMLRTLLKAPSRLRKTLD